MKEITNFDDKLEGMRRFKSETGIEITVPEAMIEEHGLSHVLQVVVKELEDAQTRE